MTEETGYRALLGRRRNRMIAIMLSDKEEFIDPYLDDETAQELRKLILDRFNEFSDFCMDMIDSIESGMVLNDLVLDKLDQLLERDGRNL